MITIGIPRAFLYYDYGHCCRAFFEELGARVIVSGESNLKILDKGAELCVDEACLALKLFYGHTADIKNKVDYLFIPRLTSISKGEYICPKIGGLPDLVRHTIPGVPKLISPEINLRKSYRQLIPAVLEAGRYFTGDDRKIMTAYRKAANMWREDTKHSLIIPPAESPSLNIAVIGHSYNVHDRIISMNTLEKLKSSGASVYTCEMLPEELINNECGSLSKKIFWHYGRKTVGSCLYLSKQIEIDGIIFLMTYGCGVDSFMADYAERKIRRQSSVPFMLINLDEHTGEAGLNTRLEAFTDMVGMRKSEYA